LSWPARDRGPSHTGRVRRADRLRVLSRDACPSMDRHPARDVTASTLRIFEEQEHNAVDTISGEFAATVSSFLLAPHC
jgi:hypothetical protein